MIALLLAVAVAAAPPLEEIRGEPLPERRYERALAYCDTAFAEARVIARSEGEAAKLAALLDALGEAAELSAAALRDTGKRPNKLTRQYKRGEQRMRALIKNLENLEKALPFDWRGPAAKALRRVQVVHEEYLLAVMGGK
jgi:hypothetical protein